MEKLRIGGFLKEFRKIKKLSQQRLALLVGTSPGFVSGIEDDSKSPGADFLYSLKIAFPDLDMNYIFSKEGEIFKSVLKTDCSDCENRLRELEARLDENRRVVNLMLGNVEVKRQVEKI